MLRPLSIPVPPMLEECVGAGGCRGRYVGFWAEAGVLWIGNGESKRKGCWQAWLEFVEHECVDTELRRYCAGDRKPGAEHVLILDRERGKWYIENRDRADGFLRLQHLGRRLSAGADRQKPSPPRAQADGKAGARSENAIDELIRKTREVSLRAQQMAEKPLAEAWQERMREMRCRDNLRKWLDGWGAGREPGKKPGAAGTAGE